MAVKDPAKDDRTQATDQSSIYDSILSSCCCGGSSAENNSLADKGNEDAQKKQEEQQLSSRKAKDETPKFLERLGDAALFLIGAAPPVKFVRCFECSSVDGSAITTPRALDDLAYEYDKNNNISYMFSTSTSTDGGEDQHQQDQSTSHEPNNATAVPLKRRNRSRSSRWADKISKSYSNKSESKSVRSRLTRKNSGAQAQQATTNGTSSSSKKPERGTVVKHTITDSISKPVTMTKSRSGKSRSSRSRAAESMTGARSGGRSRATDKSQAVWSTRNEKRSRRRQNRSKSRTRARARAKSSQVDV